MSCLLHGLNERSFTKYIPWAYQIRDAGIESRWPCSPCRSTSTGYGGSGDREQWQAMYGPAAVKCRATNTLTGSSTAVIQQNGWRSIPSASSGVSMQAYWDIIDIVARNPCGSPSPFHAGCTRGCARVFGGWLHRAGAAPGEPSHGVPSTTAGV
ncbi:MAG: hypothetical protein MZV64_49215 [Ignavibacteriales bacterium]|nr:hypothetical protein [Ignavibacteriales bacterium]